MRRRFINNSKVKFDFNNYLSIEALEDGLIVIFSNDLEYCIDGNEWTPLKGGYTSPLLNKGQIISFRAELIPNGTYGVGRFNINKPSKLLGNCNSILFSDNASNHKEIPYDYAFCDLFYN